MEGRGGEGGVRERGEARRGRGLWFEEDVVSRSRALLKEVLSGGIAPDDGRHGAWAAGVWRKTSGELQLPLLEELLVLHLLQLLTGLHLRQLLVLMTHLLKEGK